MTETITLYEDDPIAWGLCQAELIKSGRWAELDIEHLIAELIGMGISDSNELENRLTILLAHLLKWQFQYQKLAVQWQGFAGQSWRSTIIEQRDRIQKRLRRSPGLKSKLHNLLTEAYRDAISLAAKETNLPYTTFPPNCPYTWQQIIDDNFYPQ